MNSHGSIATQYDFFATKAHENTRKCYWCAQLLSMKILFSYILIVVTLNGYSQKNLFEKFEQDTIKLSNIAFKKTVGLVLDEAIIYIRLGFFEQKLHEEWKGCKKDIRQQKRIASHNTSILAYISDPLKEAQQAFIGLDSAYRYLLKNKHLNDTTYLSYKTFFTKSRFGDFIPNLIENNQCAISDKNFIIQSFIIRQIGWKRNGSYSSGSRLYFLVGHENHFWSNWDWST